MKSLRPEPHENENVIVFDTMKVFNIDAFRGEMHLKYFGLGKWCYIYND